MKATAILIALFPVVCFAQKSTTTTAEKPATDACPTFKKVKQPSKAAYYQMLRTPKKANAELAYAPKTASAKKQPKEQPEVQRQKPYVPSFTGSTDSNIPPVKAAPAKEEKPRAVPAEKPAEKKESAKPETTTEKASPLANNEKAKTKRKAAKKQNTCASPKKVKASKRNNEKCPAF